ncbi:MAG: tryptophan synthase subunit alpha [Planctomycetota bacterium]|nr:MAG: tryptophan synthase subunit alpha [Planctomycetota bacterium]REJ95784.1 MAG: tryptophan synthase subunit alpha [Planctomycetota bacterium]REK25359.1 MAG: tryptophan synthase subunit alpha [Planctomycetota bacterium]REK43494.1 MAG: tryptophan synthase subunit alpha [Planctomycetota bacterium]
MSAVDELFSRLKGEGRKALMPFVVAGDPDLDFTARLIASLSGLGCHLCEVGIPYSDPIADGPVIQAAYSRALDKHVTLAAILDMLRGTAAEVSAPLVTMVSYAIVYRHGLEAYVADAKAAGAAGLIVPDLPVEESGRLAKICAAEDLSLIQLVTPTTSPERTKQIVETSTGFLYYVSVVGITGERNELPPELVENVGRLREQTELPICIGFGISTPEHVRLLAPVADGLIVGSAIVRQIAECESRSADEVQQQVEAYVAELLAALG